MCTYITYKRSCILVLYAACAHKCVHRVLSFLTLNNDTWWNFLSEAVFKMKIMRNIRRKKKTYPSKMEAAFLLT